MNLEQTQVNCSHVKNVMKSLYVGKMSNFTSIHEARNSIYKMNLKLSEISKQLSDQKFNLLLDICKLKEIEANEKETCMCVVWCAINHKIQSWNKSPYIDIFSKFPKITNGSISDFFRTSTWKHKSS
jgi:hypothetical protein